MSGRIEMTVAPTSFSLAPGETAEAIVTVRNLGQTVDQFTLSAEGLDPGWYVLPVSSVALFPNDQDRLKIVLQPPKAPAPKSGTYVLRIKIISQESPQEPALGQLNVDICALAELELSLSPPSLTGRQGEYRVLVKNPGGREAKVELSASCRGGGGQCELSPQGLVVAPAGQSEAGLTVKPGWSGLLLEKKLGFEVKASIPGAEAKTVTGQFVSRPWYKYLSSLRIPWLSRPPAIETFRAATEDQCEFKLGWAVKRASVVKLEGEEVDPRGERLLAPSEATNYTLTATNRYGTTSQKVAVQPRPLPKARASERIKVSLSPDKAQASAGGVPSPVVVQVQNLGEIVDKFTLELQGLEEGWYSRSASSVALMPQASDQLQVMFQPPKKKGVREKTYPFAIAVRSQVKPEDIAVVTGVLEVLPQKELKLGVHPYRISARRKGTYLVRLENIGVSDITPVLSATDLDEGLRFKFKGDGPVLHAWKTIEVPMIARPKRGSMIGEKKRYDITITAAGDGFAAQSVNCELNHAPFLASWKPILRLVRALVTLAILGVVVYFVLQWGGGWRTLTSSPQQFMDTLTRTVERWFFR